MPSLWISHRASPKKGPYRERSELVGVRGHSLLWKLISISIRSAAPTTLVAIATLSSKSIPAPGLWLLTLKFSVRHSTTVYPCLFEQMPNTFQRCRSLISMLGPCFIHSMFAQLLTSKTTISMPLSFQMSCSDQRRPRYRATWQVTLGHKCCTSETWILLPRLPSSLRL
jgi:hypothetical protein